MTTTARALADQVLEARQSAWAKSDYATAIVQTEQLTPEDAKVVRRVVADAGYQGEEMEQMVKQVSDLVVGTVEALADDMPATGGD
ncbi:unnamed protein product [Gemmataceae bacterium]|nr:unnamed protein product [Gemmataceae bacterium]VTT96820.1 unnamed protein product [Gemmataceae bacterium]